MVMVIAEVATPFASTGPVPVIVEVRALGPEGLKITEPPVLVTGVTIDNIFVSGFSDFKEQVEIPVALDALHPP